MDDLAPPIPDFGGNLPLTSGVGGSLDSLRAEIARTTNPEGKADLQRELVRLQTPKGTSEMAPAIPDFEGGSRESSPGYSRGPLESLGRATLAEAVSLTDLVAGIPAQLIGVGADMGMRARAVGQGKSAAEAARAGVEASSIVNETLGSPLHKLISLAGLGKEEGQSDSVVDATMNRLAKWLEKGGEWVEDKTGGAVRAEDVQSIVNTAMGAAGGRGLAAGLEKTVPKSLQLEGVKLSPYALKRLQEERMQSMDPKDAAKVPEAQAAQAATVASEGKTRMTEGKSLVFDPIKGTLEEAAPPMGEGLPKPTSLDTAMEKLTSGRSFDMTAEERIALKGWEKAEPETPLVDEQGTPFKDRPISSGRYGSQRGAVDFTGKQPTNYKELMEKVLGTGGQSLQDFAKTLRGSVNERVAATKLAAQNYGELGLYQWDKGDTVYSKSTGKTYEITARSVDLKTGEPKYFYKGQEGEAGTFNADKAHETLKQVGGDKLNSQSGAVDPKLLASMAAIGLGAWAGQHFGSEHDLFDAVIGAGAGALLARVTPRKAVETFKKLSAPDTRIKINDLADAQENMTKLGAIDTWGLQTKITDLVPKAERREAITHAVESGDLSSLSPKEREAAKIYTDFAEQKLWEGIDNDILKSAKDDYVTHIWDWSKNDKSLLEKWLDRSGGQGMGAGTPYAKERSIPTIAEGKKQGLTPLTEDIATIMGIYGNSLTRAIANKQFLEGLKNEKTPSTGPLGPQRPISLVMPAGEAPFGYTSISHPQFAGLKVHPDIAPSIRLLFDTSSPGAAMKILQGLSDTSKRVAVSFSLFHAKALTDAMIGGSSNPFKAVAKIPGILAGTDKYLQELKKGSASELVRRAVDGGLQFSLDRAGVEDTGTGFYKTMESLQGFMDKTIPGAGLPVKGLVELNHQVDKFMWARLHAGMKLNMFAEKMQQLIDNSAQAAAKGRGQALTPEQASRIAASYTNDLFGGLNWRRIADDAKTRWGRELGQTMLTPGSRRVLQLAMFAPDWTISTTRAAVQAFGPGSGFRGLLKPTELADLHRQYLLRAGLYYLVVGDAINYSMSGHHLWNNKDWTILDLNAEGTKHMQWSKHTMEPVHWVTKPAQQAINKMGMLPRETIEQALNVEYLSAKGRMPPMHSRVRHFASNFAPIAVQQSKGGVGEGLAGFAGVPIYGQTDAERERAREERKRKKELAQ